jgi:hypothetical protein
MPKEPFDCISAARRSWQSIAGGQTQAEQIRSDIIANESPANRRTTQSSSGYILRAYRLILEVTTVSLALPWSAVLTPPLVSTPQQRMAFSELPTAGPRKSAAMLRGQCFLS